jgi:hypothetical protein
LMHNPLVRTYSEHYTNSIMWSPFCHGSGAAALLNPTA